MSSSEPAPAAVESAEPASVQLVVDRLPHGWGIHTGFPQGHDHPPGHDHDHDHDHAHGHGGSDADMCLTSFSVLRAAGLHEKGVVELAAASGRKLLMRVTGFGTEDEPKARIGRHAMRALKVTAGDTVTMTPVDLGPARRVVLEPLAPLTRSLQAYEDELSDLLAERAQLVQAGTLIPVELPDFRRPVMFRVDTASPDRAVVGPETRIVLRTSLLTAGASANLVTFEDVGGLRTEIDQLRELVECPLLYPEIYDQLGIEAPRGILLHGPPGVGKTHLARAVANEIGAHFVYVNGPEVLSSVQGGTEANLRAIFEEAMASAPSIVLIDELDAIAPPRRDSGHSDARMGTQLLSLLDGLVSMEDVIVIGTTNRADALDAALRRPGRLDREILLGPPNADGRLEILRIHTRGMPLSDAAQEYLTVLARVTHGYTGADLVNLVREAGLHALRRGLGPGLAHLRAQREHCHTHLERVSETDLRHALGQTKPSALREAVVTTTGVRWNDIAGLESAIEVLRDTVEMPLQHPEAFADIGLAPSAGVLIHGASGTGKSMLAMAVANESGANLVTVNGPEIFSKWLGQSEEAIRDAFQLARQSAPTVIVLDQLDAMAPRRLEGAANPAAQRVVNQLLIEIDGIRGSGHVVVIGVTNRLDLVDTALLRPGRLGLQIHLDLPEAQAREQIVRVHIGAHLAADDADADTAIRTVAKQTDGYSGALLAAICDHARALALRESDYARHTRVAGRHLLAAAEVFELSRSSADDAQETGHDHSRLGEHDSV